MNSTCADSNGYDARECRVEKAGFRRSLERDEEFNSFDTKIHQLFSGNVTYCNVTQQHKK